MSTTVASVHLDNCPYCHAEPDINITHDVARYGTKVYQIACTNPGCRQHPYSAYMPELVSTVSEWNRHRFMNNPGTDKRRGYANLHIQP